MSTHRLRRTETAQRLATTVSTPTPGNTTLPRPYGTHVLQSVPSTHSGPFTSTKGLEYLLKGLEATLSDSKKKYGDKVNALLSAWEHVSNYIPAAPPEATQSLIEWAHRHTLTLVLRGEWPKLAPVAKTHLCVTLQKCVSHLTQHPAAPRCTALLALVHNPWTHPTLDSILNGQPDSEHEEEFCCSEKGELLTMRLKILCEDRCEDIAVNLAAACVRSLRRSDQLRSLSESHHVHYMIDVYIVLLYKLKRTQDIFAQLKLMDLSDGLELVQRLSGERPTKYGTARVWRNSIKAAELVAQYLVTAGMVRPVSETGANILEQILNSWALLHAKLKDVAPTLPGMIRKLIEPAESAQHIYIFCAVLAKHFGDSIKPLVIELYIRALTTDMNELESQKAKSDDDKVRETAKRLSTQFLKLADVVDSNIGIARECVLTAFSLHPTRICYDRIKELAVACGKAKEDGGPQDTSTFEEKNKLKELGEESPCLPGALKDAQTKSIGNDDVKPTISAAPSSSMPPEVQQQHPSQDSTISSTEKNIDFQSGQVTETFEHTNQLLKSLLTRNPDATTNNDRCPLRPKCELSGPLSELCFNCDEFINSQQLNVNKSQPTALNASAATPPVDGSNVERTLDALILIKGDAVTGSANYDETSVPSQVLDGEKLGLSPQLCDDLAVVLSSPRYHMLSWVLDWNELKGLCERYLENAEEMRNTNKELKYLNIDYSQFKDWPSEEDTKDVFFGIEKGYEQWVDPPSDNSEQFGSFQPAGGYKRSSTRRSIDDTTDSDSGSILRVRRAGRARKVLRLESSESDCDSAERKPKHFRNRISSVSDSDSNTQDSQTDSLGSDGCRLETKKKSNKSNGKEAAKKRPKSSKLTVESVSHFHMLVNEDARHTSAAHEDASGSDVSSDIITLFSADMDENKRETIKGSTYTAAAPLIITERRSDPAVLKSLRMFRPQNSKKPTRIAQLLQKNLVNKSKDNGDDRDEQQAAGNIAAKFAPMLSTLNLNPKIVLTRADEADCKQLPRAKKPQQRLSSGDITSELINIQKTMPYNKSVMTTYQKQKERATGKSNNSSGKNDLGCSVVVDSRHDHRHHLGAVKSNLEFMSSIASTNKQPTIIDNTFLVTGGPSSSDSQESPVQQTTEMIDRSCKIGNGLLYGNARLQEAWEPEGKVSPDTPWRYIPTSMNMLNNEPFKAYVSNSNSTVTLDGKKEQENRMSIPNSRDDMENGPSVLQIINKGHSIEMASGQIYQSNMKKYFMNHTLESFGNKNSMLKAQLMPRLDRELMQQRMDRKTAAYERELKLQKSLSEECEDLGVDEPSTSELFPEADLLFDTNHSPSYDHSSQDASCSQPLGMKPYNNTYFRTMDSSSGSRDDSPINDLIKMNERKKGANQRARTLKDSMKRSKREKEDSNLVDHSTKHMRLTLDSLSQDEASNSNSDMSRLSPGNLGSLENDSSKDMSHRAKLISRIGSKEGTPSSVSSIPSNMKLDMDMDSESLPPSMNVNNISMVSDGDESLTLLGGNTADVTIPSPLSPMTNAGPLLSTHNKYTYINKKRMTSSKVHGYMAWESPMSERTRSSSDDEDSSVSESISSQPEDNILSNGLEDSVQTLKALAADRRCTYVKKKDKLQVKARVVLNRADHTKAATVLPSMKRLPKTTAETIAAAESLVMSSDKVSEASEDEANNIVLSMEPDCRARRSSLRGHVKKGCACCNGSPERPKKKTTAPTVKPDHTKQKKRLLAKQPGKKR